MSTKTIQRTEYEVCTLDADGDIVDITFCANKKEGLKEFAEEWSPCELYKVVHTAVVLIIDPEFTVSTERNEELIDSK